ncbi:16454_t:CDS:1, partial [Acaulospora colombiana]
FVKMDFIQPTDAQRLIDGVGIEIFRHTDVPLNLLLSCKGFYQVSLDPHSRATWVIFKYGKAQALFHAVRLGPNFINVQVVKLILANGGILSRYFVQRLLMHFGRYDSKLIELKIQHNVGQIDPDRIRSFQEKIKSPWASNLPVSVFTYLITEASNQLQVKEMASKGNDMELFHFLSAGPHVISEAPEILEKNKEFIEELILKMKFIPFPPRPKPKRSDSYHSSAKVPEEYPPKDGYENSRQLNVIARAILICKDLVILWKKIGYHQICNDVNDLVMQGALLILFPPTPPSDYVRPDVTKVNERLEELITLGFELNYTVIGDIMQLFEHRLADVGNIFIESFIKIKKISVKELIKRTLIESIKPE